MTVYLLLGLRYLRRRGGRAALIIASIALGVATLVSSQSLNQIIEQAANESVAPMKGAAALSVTNGTMPVRKDLADELRKAKVPGVTGITPLLFTRVNLSSIDDRPAVLFGVDLANPESKELGALPAKITIFDPQEMLGFALGSKAIVSKAVFDVVGKEATLSIRIGNRKLPLKLAGYYEAAADSPVNAIGRNVVVMELNAACRFLMPNSPACVDRIDITVDGDVKDVQERLQKIVGDRATVAPPELTGQSAKEIITGVKTAFTLCSLGALVVGLFLVYNAMSVTVAERQQDIGMMRSVGATRLQIVILFTFMAAVLGLIGAVLGLPLGLAFSNYAMSEFREVIEAIFLNPDEVQSRPTPQMILLAMAAGVLTAVLAALIPAIQAAGNPPAEVARRGPTRISKFWRWLHRGLCFVLVGGGVLMILLRAHLPHRVGSFGGMVITLVGLLLATPIFVSILVRLFNPLLRRVLPIEARLASDNLTRAPGRTGVVIGALAAGVAVMIQTAGVGRSNEKPVSAWLDQMLRADLYVFGGSFVSGTASMAAMDPGVVVELRKSPGVETATGLRFARPEFNGTIIYVIAVDTGPFGEQLGKRSDLQGLAKYKLAKDRTVLVSDNFSRRHKLKPGDSFKINGPNGLVELTIAGTVLDYSWSRGTVIMDRSAYAKHFADAQIDFAHVFFKPGEEAAARAALEPYFSKEGLSTQEPAAMRETIGGFVTRFYALAYLQQLVVGVVAALGVVTALLISVLQRKRELGLLLAVGATPGQVVRSVLWEALFMGGLGTLLGLMTGILLEWYVVELIFLEESGFALETLIPWGPGLSIAAGSLALAAIAGLMPSWHAVRTNIPEAIAYQ